MYGRTNQPDFRGIEGYEDHAVEVLFFFDRQKKLLAAAINLACTAQEVEGRSAVNADFFHEVRQALREKHGRDLKVLGWIGAAGDQSPHLMFRQRAEDRMRQLRGLSRLQEISRRIVLAFDEAYDGAKGTYATTWFWHRVARLDLPVRMVTDEEAAAAKAKVESLSKDPPTRRLSDGTSKSSTVTPTRKAARLTKSKSTCSVWATWRLRPIPSNYFSITASRSKPAARPCRRS